MYIAFLPTPQSNKFTIKKRNFNIYTNYCYNYHINCNIFIIYYRYFMLYSLIKDHKIESNFNFHPLLFL